MAVNLSALRAGRSLPPRKFPGTHFCYSLSRPQGHSAAGRIRSIEKSNDLVGNRTYDLPAFIVARVTYYPDLSPEWRWSKWWMTGRIYRLSLKAFLPFCRFWDPRTVLSTYRVWNVTFVSDTSWKSKKYPSHSHVIAMHGASLFIYAALQNDSWRQTSCIRPRKKSITRIKIKLM
jgi:hypothetical protein